MIRSRRCFEARLRYKLKFIEKEHWDPGHEVAILTAKRNYEEAKGVLNRIEEHIQRHLPAGTGRLQKDGLQKDGPAGGQTDGTGIASTAGRKAKRKSKRVASAPVKDEGEGKAIWDDIERELEAEVTLAYERVFELLVAILTAEGRSQPGLYEDAVVCAVVGRLYLLGYQNGGHSWAAMVKGAAESVKRLDDDGLRLLVREEMANIPTTFSCPSTGLDHGVPAILAAAARSITTDDAEIRVTSSDVLHLLRIAPYLDPAGYREGIILQILSAANKQVGHVIPVCALDVGEIPLFIWSVNGSEPVPGCLTTVPLPAWDGPLTKMPGLRLVRLKACAAKRDAPARRWEAGELTAVQEYIVASVGFRARESGVAMTVVRMVCAWASGKVDFADAVLHPTRFFMRVCETDVTESDPDLVVTALGTDDLVALWMNVFHNAFLHVYIELGQSWASNFLGCVRNGGQRNMDRIRSVVRRAPRKVFNFITGKADTLDTDMEGPLIGVENRRIMRENLTRLATRPKNVKAICFQRAEGVNVTWAWVEVPCDFAWICQLMPPPYTRSIIGGLSGNVAYYLYYDGGEEADAELRTKPWGVRFPPAWRAAVMMCKAGLHGKEYIDVPSDWDVSIRVTCR
jgi:hypothetical protein